MASGGTGNHGILINPGITVSPANFIAQDIMGGPGNNNNTIGFYIHGGTLGSSASNLIFISAGSLSTGASNSGIQVDTSGTTGMIIVGNGGTIDLVGTGGGFYSNLGSNNYGINLNNATLIAGNGGSAVNTINMTGIGGPGLLGL